jgi:hypothetical protein
MDSSSFLGTPCMYLIEVSSLVIQNDKELYGHLLEIRRQDVIHF